MRKTILKKYAVTSLSDVGAVRKHNEDNVLVDDELNLLIVADGMGGHHAGEIASFEAIKTIQKMLFLQHRSSKNSNFFNLFGKPRQESLIIKEKEKTLEKALREANHHIFQLNVERNMISGRGMGTTIAGCWFITLDLALIFHVGDSRVYLFRDQELEALTKDHSILQEWYDGGCVGEKPNANVIFNAIGPYPEITIDIRAVRIEDKDTLLLCSDGLTDLVNDLDIEQQLKGVTTELVDNYSQSLFESAMEQGGKDNISIILMTGAPTFSEHYV